MNATDELIYNDLKSHIKIHNIEYVNGDDILFTCEIDRIQSIATGIINRIIKKYGNYDISSTTKHVKNLGHTKVFISKAKVKVNK